MADHQTYSPMPPCSHEPAPYAGPPRDEVLALRREFVAPGVFTYYKEPIEIVEGHMQYLWDEGGKRYLDAIAGVVSVSVGHCHPKIVEAVRRQVGRLMHTTTIYLHPEIALYAKNLAAHFPDSGGLTATYFTNSGSDSNDLATLMARLHTGQHDVIALRNGYHGGSQSTMALTAMGNWKFPIPHSFGVKHLACPDCYHCPFGLTYPDCDVKCAREIEPLLAFETSGKVAAFIAEPIQGAGGVIVPPPEYFKIIYDAVRAAGGLCISDEVQTGFARTGDHFWGFENYGVVPDIVTMAKGIGNGAPLGAVTTRPEIAAQLKQKLHFNTFGGNPVSIVQGKTTLEIIDAEQLQQNAKEIGGYLKQRLIDLQRDHPVIGDVRGLGLLIGVELVVDPQSKEPATELAVALHEETKNRGLLIGRGGIHGNVLRIKPPMCITREDIDFLTDCLDASLNAVLKR